MPTDLCHADTGRKYPQMLWSLVARGLPDEMELAPAMIIDNTYQMNHYFHNNSLKNGQIDYRLDAHFALHWWRKMWMAIFFSYEIWNLILCSAQHIGQRN